MYQLIGGSGFIGTQLLDILPTEDGEAINIDKAQSAKYSHITSIADVNNYAELVKSMRPAKWVVLLAAEHRDDVSPTSRYYEVNVEGAKNVLKAMNEKGINKIIFTSSVAVYGLNKNNPDERQQADPFNHYGKSKWETEEVLREWYNQAPELRTLIIIRPTVVFGPGNKGNVYNLLKQIAGSRFMMIGSGNNKKSMAYVENIVAFIKHCLTTGPKGYTVYNYADKPDLTTKELVAQAEISLGKKIAPFKIPYFIGYTGGLCFDIAAKILGKKFPISAVRVKKFCATTQFSSEKMSASGFKPPFTLQQGLDKTIQSIVSAGSNA